MEKELILKEYWSKADAFLLPLTGLERKQKYEMHSYLFWNEHSIHDYKLILSFNYDNYEEFVIWCRAEIFPVLDKRGYIVENYDVQGRSIFVLDMAEWALDIEQFLEAKYSKFSNEGRKNIEDYHIIDKKASKLQIPVHIYAVLYPKLRMKILNDMTPLEYVSKHYGFDKEVIDKIGEVGSVYDKFAESLFTEIDTICQTDTKESVEQ